MAAVVLWGITLIATCFVSLHGNGHAGRNSGPVEGQQKVCALLILFWANFFPHVCGSCSLSPGVNFLGCILAEIFSLGS